MDRHDPKQSDARWNEIIDTLESVKRDLGKLLQGDSCDLVDEKPFEGVKTAKGTACRLGARVRYLLDVLACEPNPTLVCCATAAQDYCDAWEACPD